MIDQRIHSSSFRHRDHALVLMATMSMLAVTFFALLFEPAIDWEKLPDAKKLAWYAERACAEHRLNTGEVPEWPLKLVAQAHVYNREFRRARRAARPLTGVWRATFETTAVQIESEQTRWVSHYPRDGVRQFPSEATDDETWGVITVAGIAEGLARAGHFEQARFMMRSIESTRGGTSILMDHLIKVAGMQIDSNDKDGANRSLTECMAISERLRRSSFRFEEQMVSVAELWERNGNTEKAIQVAHDLETLLKATERTETDSALATQFLAKEWARLGRCYSSIGVPERSKTSFLEAGRLADASLAQSSKGTPENSGMERKYFAELLAQIAAWQFESGWQTEADQGINRVLSAMEMKGDPDHFVERPSTGSLAGDMILSQVPAMTNQTDRDFRLSNVVQKLAPARYRQAILRTVSEMKGDYSKLCGLRDWSRSDPSASSEWEPILSEIESRATAHANIDERASMLTIIAELRSVSNDTTLAKKAFKQALSASRQTDNRTQHQQIALAQIRSGYFEDALATIGEIPNAEHRLLPLGELALAIARSDYESKKR